MSITDNYSQLLKALLPIVITLFPKVNEVKFLQASKAELPIFVTDVRIY